MSLALTLSLVIILLPGLDGGQHIDEGFDPTLVQTWASDTGLRLGERGRIKCTLASGRTDYTMVVWNALLPGNPDLQALYLGMPSGIHVKDERFEGDEGSKHDLIVKEATYGVAGSYICSVTDQSGDGGQSTVAVFTLDKATCNSDPPVKDEKDTVRLVCSLRYTGPSGPNAKKPKMAWYDDGDQELTGGYYVDQPVDATPSPSDPKVLTYQYNMTADNTQHDRVYTCRVSLDDATYVDTCETSYKVRFPVTAVNFEPDFGDEVGKMKHTETINCTARGNPEPEFAWLKLEGAGPDVVTGPILHMSEEMTDGRNSYKCTASNKGPDGQPRTAHRKIKFDVTLDIGVSGSARTTSGIGLLVLTGLVLMRASQWL